MTSALLRRAPAFLAFAALAAGGCDTSSRRSPDGAGGRAVPGETSDGHAHDEESLVISEVMADPAAVPDERGEWIEVANPGHEPVFLQGWTLASGSGRGHVISRPLVVAPGGAVVLARDGEPAANGGVQPLYVYGGGVALGNSSGWVALRDPSGETVDSVAWSRSPRRGASWALVHPDQPHADIGGPAWEVSAEPFGKGDRGSPGRTAWGPGSGESPEGQAPADGEGTASSSEGGDSAGSGDGGTGGRDSDGSDGEERRDAGRNSRDSGERDSLGQADTDGGSTSRGGNGEAIYRDHLEFGTPRDDTPDDDYLMRKRQYALSYNPRRNGANWVAWNLNRTHFGAAPRSNAFTADPELPRRFARVITSDYSGSGYSRGHMVRSEERTATPADNAATFLLTNILPQTQDLNAGPWLGLERYLQEQAQRGGREIYVIAGGIYPPRPETLNGRGKVAIPTRTWKIAVLLPYGQGLRDVTSARQLRVIAVDMPNETGIATRPWRDYQTTVDALEKATGYDFLDRLPDAIETVVESRR